MTVEFMGFARADGRVGVRNVVAILSAMDNTNPTAQRIASMVAGTVVLSTPFGRTQIGHDFEMTLKTLAGLPAAPQHRDFSSMAERRPGWGSLGRMHWPERSPAAALIDADRHDRKRQRKPQSGASLQYNLAS